MKIIAQRVSEASVTVDSRLVGSVGRGLLLLVGFGKGDDESLLKQAAEKVVNLRIFPDDRDRFDKSLLDIQGEILAVSQFTLFADTAKGRRPEFFGALEPQRALELFNKYLDALRAAGATKVEQGEFGARMKVSLLNDGPVTIPLEFTK